ncbi:hypothetical protein MCAMS1_01650 [biofilm metagenome]
MANIRMRYGSSADAMKASYTQACKLLLLALNLVLPGCAVGPDFKHPLEPQVTDYTITPVASQTSSAPTRLGEAQRIIRGKPVDAQWWRSFKSPRLDVLIETALRASPSLASARATLHEAQELYVAQAGATLYPQVGVHLAAQRQRFNPIILGQTNNPREFSLYNAGIDVHYQFDLAGGNRRALEALAAGVEYRRYEMEAAQLTLAGNVIVTAVTQAKLAAQMQATEAILNAQDEQLRLAQKRMSLGQTSQDEVSALRIQVEHNRAGLPLLRKQLQQSQHLLAVLAGQAPGAFNWPTFTLEEFTLTSDLPLVVPSELVRRRPDIQAAEALLHAANAEYGVAISRMYPQLNLSASLATQALVAGALFGPGSAIWNLIGQITQPLFNPALPAEKRAALAAFDAAAANYHNVVLESLRHVADVLRALENDAQSLVALATADAAARDSLQSVERQYALGAVSYIQLLTAQEQVQQSQINLLAAQAQRLFDTTALYQAMGGGVS